MRNIVFGVLLLVIFIMPWEAIFFFAEFGTLTRWVGYLAALLAAFSVFTEMSMKLPSLTFVVLCLSWLWATLSYFWSLQPAYSASALLTPLSLLVFVWMLVEFARTYQQQLWVMRTYLLGCTIPLTLLYAAFIAAGGRGGMRFSAAGYNANYLANVLLYSVPMAIYLASRSGEKLRIVYWGYAGLASIGLLLSGSRASALGLIILGGLMALKLLRARWPVKVMLLICGVALIVVIPKVVPSDLLERAFSFREIEIEGQKREGRMEIWTRGWEKFQQYPIAGIGINAFGEELFGNWRISVHNVFLSYLYENGIVGFTIYLLFLGMLANNVRKLPRAERSLWIEILLPWSLIAMTAPNEYNKTTWMIYGLILSQSALYYSLRYQAQRIPFGLPRRTVYIPGADRPYPAR